MRSLNVTYTSEVTAKTTDRMQIQNVKALKALTNLGLNNTI